MNLLDFALTVTKIVTATFVPFGKGAPVHKNRPSHGLAMNVGCDSLYRFDTGVAIECHDGDCIFLPKGSNYVASTIEQTESDTDADVGVYAINFLISEDVGALEPFVISPKSRDDVLSHFARAERAWRRRDELYHEECFISLYSIIRLLRKSRAAYMPKQRTLEMLEPALKYMNENCLSESVSVTHLAALCGVSEPYFRRLFRTAFSSSPAVYMRNMRIKHAKRLLRSGEYSVTDAAFLSGFSDAAYFSREFKRSEGVSPSEYLENNLA